LERTPYSYEFLWRQVEAGYKEIRKEKYRKLVEQFLFDENIRKNVEKLKDKTGRNYEGGLLEKTASVISLALCTYDNYPEIDIDLILCSIILSCLCATFPKRECYEKIKEYDELIPFLFKKKRKKPTLELTVYDGLIKLDNKIYLKLERRRGENKKGEVK